MKKLLITITIIVLATLASAAPDVVFQAMTDELQRTMDSLSLEGMSKPYYAAYRVIDSDNYTIEGWDGALTKSDPGKSRLMTMELRVGSPTRDNGWFVGSYNDLYVSPRSMPVENEYLSIRHQIWLTTDKAYKNALENLARKNSYYQSHPTSEMLPDFSSADTTHLLLEPLSLAADVKVMEVTVAKLCEALKKHSTLNEWKVSYSATTSNRRYLNSEGSKALTGAQTQSLEISASAQASDGQRLSTFKRFYVRDDDKLPTREELIKLVDAFAAELEAMAAATPLTDYSGPVLFSGDAASQLLSELFVYNLSPVNKIPAFDDRVESFLTQGKYAVRLNRRVLPEFMSIVDDPGLKTWKNRRCLGYRLIDDEGVKPQRLTLVENGKLVALPATRVPSKKISRTNGHARMLANQWIIPSVTTVAVQAKNPVSFDALIGKIREMCRESGVEYGLLIKQLSDSQVDQTYSWSEPGNDDQQQLSSPIIAYKVFEKDGKLEPVRGLMFDEVSIRSLRDIIAVGNDDELYNMQQPTIFGPGNNVAISLITPSLLIDEMELKASQKQEPMFQSPRPLVENK